jgi:hypothetical protein
MHRLLTSDNRLSLLFYGFLALWLVIPSYGLSRRLCEALRLPLVLTFGGTLLLLGACAEATFFLTMISHRTTVALACVAALGGTAYSATYLRSAQNRCMLARQDCLLPYAITAACGIAYLCLFAIAIPAGGSIPSVAT